MNIIGVSAFYHEAACCLISDGQLLAMAAEERFSRMKHDARLPTHAFHYCLREGGLHPGDIDCIAYYEQPRAKLSRQLSQAVSLRRDEDLGWLDSRQPLLALRDAWGYCGEIRCFPHHLSHAASSFYFSGFEEAAFLVVDGVGEWDTTSYGTGNLDGLDIFDRVRFPHSLGLFYAALTAFLGFRVNNGEYKVMGLAPYGKPRYLKQMRSMLHTESGGGFTLDMRYFDYVDGNRMFSPAMEALLGGQARKSHQPLTSFHHDVACSLQAVLEEVLLEKVGYLHQRTQADFLCLAGGVALNCVANGRIRREGAFKDVFVQPAAGDDGGCLGAAALAADQLSGKGLAPKRLTHTFFGPAYSRRECLAMLAGTGLPFVDFAGKEADLLEKVVAGLLRFEIVGWFHGRMEMGPRALGSRSILANPMDPQIRERLNARVKKREGFRPFAPSVLASEAVNHFDLATPSPFMLETCQVRSPLDLPGITHVNGSARPQTVDRETAPRFAALLQHFHGASGCPLLVNTSFNLRGEPIVCDPEDALICAVRANLDLLVLGDLLVEIKKLPRDWEVLAEYMPGLVKQPPSPRDQSLVDNLYSFV